MKAKTVSINTNIEHIVLDEQEGMSAAVENARAVFYIGNLRKSALLLDTI